MDRKLLPFALQDVPRYTSYPTAVQFQDAFPRDLADQCSISRGSCYWLVGRGVVVQVPLVWDAAGRENNAPSRHDQSAFRKRGSSNEEVPLASILSRLQLLLRRSFLGNEANFGVQLAGKHCIFDRF
jgi:hypothetical protein